MERNETEKLKCLSEFVSGIMLTSIYTDLICMKVLPKYASITLTISTTKCMFCTNVLQVTAGDI
jgi:hypothetical protein